MSKGPQKIPANDHTTVMPDEIREFLNPRAGGKYADATFGNGGASRILLDAATCRVWGIDRDPEAIARGQALAEQYDGRLTMVQGCFGDMDQLLDNETGTMDGVTLDLGVSSMQLDQAERGFSFQADGPLDMRMGQNDEPGRPSAADLVNSLSESELADIIFNYGEERRARQVARAIVEARQDKPITRTLELASIVRRVVKRSKDGPHEATRTFQALRIAVNDELGELDRGLVAAERLLAPGGRLAVISFHSLESRAVKRFLTERSGTQPRGSRHLPEVDPTAGRDSTFTLLFKGARKPSEAECRSNPRSRSARLRAAQRTEAAAWSLEHSGGTA